LKPPGDFTVAVLELEVDVAAGSGSSPTLGEDFDSAFRQLTHVQPGSGILLPVIFAL
jgi:hypothetical protein